MHDCGHSNIYHDFKKRFRHNLRILRNPFADHLSLFVQHKFSDFWLFFGISSVAFNADNESYIHFALSTELHFLHCALLR